MISSSVVICQGMSMVSRFRRLLHWHCDKSNQLELKVYIKYIWTKLNINWLLYLILNFLQALNFLGFLSIAISGNAGYSQASFFDSISGFAFWFSGILLALYLFHIVEKFFKIPWLKIVSKTFLIAYFRINIKKF